MPRSPFPSYLTSGASSRSHHALLVKLHDSASSQEEEEIIAAELSRCQLILGKRSQNTSVIADTLVIVLYCATSRSRSKDNNLAWALLPALELAEGGKTIRERRLGYLFLTERLPPGHELGLMMVNTLRKDLSSSREQDVLLALHTIVKLPLAQSAPAVIPLLSSKQLLRHCLPAVRQRTLEALMALYLLPPSDSNSTAGSATFPLDQRKMTRLLRGEEDTSVLCVLLRMKRVLLETGRYTVENEDERLSLVQAICKADERFGDGHGQLSLEVVKTLRSCVQSATSFEPSTKRALQRVLGRLSGMRRPSRWQAAYLLEACSLAAILPNSSADNLHGRCVALICNLLSPASGTASSSLTTWTPSPNDHSLALRCLFMLPSSSWDGKLSESEMGIIMEGLDHVDNTIRRLTLRLISRMADQLIDITFNTHLECLRSRSNLYLPLESASSTGEDQKLRLGLSETGLRALEVVQVRHQADVRTSGTDGHDTGGHLADAIGELVETWQSASDDRAVWEEAVKDILGFIKTVTAQRQLAFVTVLLEQRHAGPTLNIIRASVLCEVSGGLSPHLLRVAADVLSLALSSSPVAVQEILMVTLFVILCRLQHTDRSAEVIRIQESLASLSVSGPKSIRKRSKQISAIIELGLLDQVMDSASSSSIPDVLASILTVYTKLPVPGPTSLSLSGSPSSVRAAPLPASQLRYDAYDSPSTGKKRHMTRSISQRLDEQNEQDVEDVDDGLYGERLGLLSLRDGEG